MVPWGDGAEGRARGKVVRGRRGKGEVVWQFPVFLGNAQVGFEADTGWCQSCILYLVYSPHWSLCRVNEPWCVLCPSACSSQSMKCHWNLLKSPVHSRTFVPRPCCIPVYNVKSCCVLGTALCSLRGIAVPITMISVLWLMPVRNFQSCQSVFNSICWLLLKLRCSTCSAVVCKLNMHFWASCKNSSKNLLELPYFCFFAAATE